MAAGNNGHLEVVHALLAAGADMEAKDEVGGGGHGKGGYGGEKGSLKVHIKQLMVTTLLLVPCAQDGRTALLLAIMNGNPLLIQALRAAGANWGGLDCWLDRCSSAAAQSALK